MYTIIRKYGPITEVTEMEKEPKKVRIYSPREWRIAYGVRRSDNIRRTRKICMWRVFTAIEKFGSPLLVTLTFSGDASDASYANDALRYFQLRLRTEFPNSQSIFIPELSPRGRIHFHGLLFNVPLSLGDTRSGGRVVSHGDERKTRMLAALWGEGFVDATKTDGSPGLAAYISKYITKGGDQILFNAMRLLRISHGFPKETVYRGVVAKKIARHYAECHKPFNEWSGEALYSGKIVKKKYMAK